MYSNFKPGSDISRENAQTIAVNWYKHWNPDKTVSSSILQYSLESYFDKPFAHVFSFSSGGWVVVSANNRMRPIIAYNFSKTISAIGLGAFSSHISDVSTSDELSEWNELAANNFSRYSSSQVLPLLTSHWHQWWPYNAYYPLDPVFYPEENGHYRLGCTITAAAQMMKYWNYPESGKGVVSCGEDPVTGLNYHNLGDDHYAWYKMPDFLSPDPTLSEEVYGPSALVN